jgi:hypothetical protein
MPVSQRYLFPASGRLRARVTAARFQLRDEV